MGDRTECRLNIFGVILESNLQKLVDTLDDTGAPTSPGDIKDHLAKNNAVFEYEEVNYGELDSDLRDVLTELNLSYWWAWSAGAGYGAGIELFDATTGEWAEYPTNDGEILLRLSTLSPSKVSAQDRERIIATAERWDTFGTGATPLVVVASRHDALAKAASDDLPEGFVKQYLALVAGATSPA